MGIEDETRVFLIRIANTIALVLLWMMLNVYLGIYWGFGFFEDRPDWKNGLFYVWFMASLFFLLRHLKRKWKY